jgi:hypothetical protein
MLSASREGLASLLAVALWSAQAVAQVPGLPVLQNAFSNPGLAFAANLGGGSGQSFLGAAAAWGLRSGAFTVSGAAGAQRANDASRGAYGARLAARIWTSAGGSLGLGGFAGFGGAPRTRGASAIVTNPAIATIPVGLSAAYRRSLGSKRGLSAYVSPFYRWTRLDSATVQTSGTIRFSAGLDFSITPSIGVTFGGEFGGSGSGNSGLTGGNSGLLGGAISFVPGGRR